MGKVILAISMSLDGYVARPDDRAGQGLGNGGEVLQEWLQDADAETMFAGVGALVVGRRMFDVSEAWGGDPPGGLPCFVLTHDVPMEWTMSGTPFTFVTEGIESAVAQARAAAGDKNVGIGGGADTARQAIDAGLVNEIQISLVPVLLGAGIRLFDGVRTAPMRLIGPQVTESPNATHLHYLVADRG